MRTEIMNIYSFNELSEVAKKKAIENDRDINIDLEWSGFIIDDWQTKLDNFGFSDADIKFSGAGSQGDGASFTARVDLDKFCKANSIDIKQSVINAVNGYSIISVKRHNHIRYVHEKSVYADIDLMTSGKEYKRLEKQIVELEKAITDKVVELSKKIYKDLQTEYEDLTSDKAVIETLVNNECEFYEDGKVYNN